jgi:hypothetical protein
MSESIDINGSVSEALERLQGQSGRDPVTGQFIAGNTAAGKTLARSEVFWQAVDDTKRELVERTKAALAVDNSTPETLLGLIDGYAEARLLRMALFQQLVSVGGPVTVKGKSRPLYAAWGQAFDREHKAAVTLGFERRQKLAASLAEVLAAHEQQANG